MIGPHVAGCAGETCRCSPIVEANMEEIRSQERARIAAYIVSLARSTRTPELTELLLDIANRVRFGVFTREVPR